MRNYYKPEKLEEIYSNIQNLENTFFPTLNNYILNYYNLNYYNLNQYDIYTQNNLYYVINMNMLSDAICQFISRVFESLSFALNYWYNSVSKKNNRVTDKQYDQGISLLIKKNKLSKECEQDILKLREQRNIIDHCSIPYFNSYIFNKSSEIYHLLQTIKELSFQMDMNTDEVLYSDMKYQNNIKDMNEFFGNVLNRDYYNNVVNTKRIFENLIIKDNDIIN